MVKLTKIYTRTGDSGTTGLVDGSRRSKAEPRMVAIGEVDEANSAIGVALLAIEGALAAQLTRIQNDLFDLGADLATPGEVEGALRIISEQVARLEAEIDAMNAALSPLTSFILPGGSTGSAHLHLARAITRRAERAAVALAEQEAINPPALAYLNRLSDWLFVAARMVNQSGASDVLWVPGGVRTGR
ncbi:ATP:cob(I)alamin adenosyltransferase [Sphingomonas sp. S17]|uniref:Corrinoid adenosyltransferase n=2 Tax=Sphingomonas paucimobilis TaxID=13689 RepID=A0A411LLD1_SPHPI|nr:MULTISPECIES: cob(I)yrinic acid a,c-diamide adenosyltransferase [Sphingomonas]EGI54722.1 ATP:cob(I)alamin adenosyltransferase [Sphingomonas sp. S17]MBQ1481807.1 cob(I)yrinic acid a,c-diamide adenosyltransferase [Sphingomonas sp.]MCM3680097.1 cob(I)yrinic acid a,c-diamide adenosyltransferase [Sphingomonas paucimobilis]MDG5970287.1 cob(I)yrinic acid a,c-diamide adenosyltransferase [Sphingomonas paucimobilis]NNG56245.1 cob(I)yrinic acid a,c-diamide adenosyltransferase [Sphingomonas paucimobili